MEQKNRAVNALECVIVRNGLSLKFRGKDFRLIYPAGIWERYPQQAKEILRDNLAHLLTVSMPLVSGVSVLRYNTSFPLFAPVFREVVTKNIPGAVEDYPQSTGETIERFLRTRYVFNDGVVEFPVRTFSPDKNSILVSFTCGKDSLLTVAMVREMGLKPTGLYINDTVSPAENRLKIKHMGQISRKFGIPVFVARNEAEKLNDFEYWDTIETCVGYCHMLAGFCFMAIPVCNYTNSGWILLGNERNMDYSFKNKDGYVTHPAFGQTSEGTRLLDGAVRLMTGGSVGVGSLIKPLHNLAIIKILHMRYPQFAKFEISCDCLDAFLRASRWCCSCSKCARLSLFMRAVGADPRSVGIKDGLLDKKSERFYVLFGGREVDFYEKNKESRDEQLLAFYLAYKNGTKGYLIEKFRKEYLGEARRREKALRKKLFGIYVSDVVPPSMRSAVYKIYRQELKDLV